MKKNYALTLDIESTERVREWLSSRGISLSGWINSLLVEFDAELQGEENSWMRKPVEQLTLAEFTEGVYKWLGKVKDLEK